MQQIARRPKVIFVPNLENVDVTQANISKLWCWFQTTVTLSSSRQRSISSAMVSFASAQRKRFCGATAAALLVMFILYSLLMRGGQSKSSGAADNAMRINGSTRSADVGANSNNPGDVCPVMPAVYDIGSKKPIWVAGYPGSGFDLLAPLIAYSTGLTAVDVYRHHTCSVPARAGAAVTGACLTHFPVIAKDAPSSVALTGAFYNPNVIFVIRNPVKAIPSYFTRWWGAQKHVQVRRE